MALNEKAETLTFDQYLYKFDLEKNKRIDHNLGDNVFGGEPVFVTKNNKQAIFWTKKAALQDNAFAQFALANAYYYGQGVVKDKKQAVYWITKVAKQGDYYAQFLLGNAFVSGDGVTKNDKKALYWWEKAAQTWSARKT